MKTTMDNNNATQSLSQFSRRAEQAFNFYKSVFGGEFAMLSRYSDMPPHDGVTLSEAQKFSASCFPAD